MKRITYPRVDLHGNIWKKKDIEAVFVGYIETKIKTNLQYSNCSWLCYKTW